MSASESESSDAPEVVSLKTTKKESKQQRKVDEERQRVEALIKKQKNQVRDARLKAEKKKAKHNNERESINIELENQDEESLRLQKRMERAMLDAKEDQDLTESEDEEMQEMNEESAEESSSDSERNPDYLPEHYFLAASSSKTPVKPQALNDKAVRRKKKLRLRKKAEEHIIGSRVIRTLESIDPPATGRTVPSTNAKKFLKRQMKGDLRTRGWERRQVAVGSMSSRAGPALKFTRV